ncbi:MAG: N-acetyltransferase [Dehalococcoidia bacterium]|nr:MAG: N-acetyltransferase [Dehalococcoidia bacterium]
MGHTMNPEVSFRAYQEADLSVCAGIGVEVFPLVTSRFSGKEVSKVMKGQVDGCHVVSNYRELAIADGEVAGLIFGRVKRRSVLIDICRTLKRLPLISVRFLLGMYGSRRKLIRFLNPCLEQLRVLRKNRPAGEAEVVLFAVAPKYQGIGIGRALMDRFVHHALTYKVKSISVPTDETASFWFYERYGFRRWAEFKDPLESYCADRPIKGFTYQLVLPEANR